MKTSITFALLLTCFCRAPASAQGFTGRWVVEEDGQRATLELRHDPATGRVAGTLAVAGNASAIAGRVQGDAVIVESMDGTSVQAGALVARAEGAMVLVLTIARAGADPVIWRMTRVGGAPSGASASGADAERASSESAHAVPATTFRNGAAQEFAGRWESLSDDQTSGEVLELVVSGGRAQGVLTVASRGYFSGRVTVENRLTLEGMLRGGSLDVTLTNPDALGETAQATLRLRGEFLVFLMEGVEMGAYGRPGRPLVASAQGSAAAASLAAAIRGRVYSITRQASGDRGAFVGGRARVAFCADGTMALDASNVGTVPGASGGSDDTGSTVTRRGRWSMVLLAGAPAVRADWEGTGSTFALTAYFRVRPADDGRSALIDGASLPLTGSC